MEKPEFIGSMKTEKMIQFAYGTCGSFADQLFKQIEGIRKAGYDCANEYKNAEGEKAWMQMDPAHMEMVHDTLSLAQMALFACFADPKMQPPVMQLLSKDTIQHMKDTKVKYAKEKK